MELKRAFYNLATENNKVFLDVLWKKPAKKRNFFLRFFWVITTIEIVVLYSVTKRLAPGWIETLLLIELWILNGFAGLILNWLLNRIDYMYQITHSLAYSLFEPDVDERLSIKKGLNFYLCIILIVALFASGWYLTSAVIIYGWFMNRLIQKKLVAYMMVWVQTDFAPDDQVDSGSDGLI